MSDERSEIVELPHVTSFYNVTVRLTVNEDISEGDELETLEECIATALLGYGLDASRVELLPTKPAGRIQVPHDYPPHLLTELRRTGVLARQSGASGAVDG